MSTNNSFDPEKFMAAKDNASDIHNKMSDIQKKLGALSTEGKAGTEGYAVTIIMNGNYEATKVTIDQELLKQPQEILCELIAAAVTDASRNATTMIQNEMFNIFKNFKLPGTT